MAKKHHPRRGSLQFWPHRRSKSHRARVHAWASVKETKLLGFVGYKSGMTHILLKEANPTSPRKQMDVFTPVTILECPPMRVYSVRYYSRDEDSRLVLTAEVFAKKTEKDLLRRLIPSKKTVAAPEAFDLVRVCVYTQPRMTGIGKKKPDFTEIGIGGKSPQEQATFAQSILDKEIKVSDVFQDNQFVDTHGVTKGKGFSGVVKKYGVKTMQHKSEKGTRKIGTLGAWHPNQVSFTVAQPGKWGYHRRTEYNKTCIKVGEQVSDVNPKGGFVRYGLLKNDYLMIKGSVAGAVKRPITVTEALRVKNKLHPSTISAISVESKQR